MLFDKQRDRGMRRGSALRSQRIARRKSGLFGPWIIVVACLGSAAAGWIVGDDAEATAAATQVQSTLFAPILAPTPEEVAEQAPEPRVARSVPAEVLARLPSTRRDILELRAPQASSELREWVHRDGTPVTPDAPGANALLVRYTLNADLTDSILRMLEQQKVSLGQIVVADARTGRLLSYAVTDPAKFGPAKTYPAASLAKVVTAAAALEANPAAFDRHCVFAGSPYKLTPARLRVPRTGNRISLVKALATSNNQCFGRLAVDTLGSDGMRKAFSSFGWLASPAPGYPAGRILETEDPYAIAELGSGLAGSSITPLHAIQLALSLVDGRVPEPFWIEHVEDADGNAWSLPERAAPAQAMKPGVARKLRKMLVETTVRGTARRAFHRRNGRPLLQEINVAGKTGSLTGTDPAGRYEWFVGVAPANDPAIAIAVVSVHGDFFLQTSSQLAAEVLRRVFCPKGICDATAANEWLGETESDIADVGTGAPARDRSIASP